MVGEGLRPEGLRYRVNGSVRRRKSEGWDAGGVGRRELVVGFGFLFGAGVILGVGFVFGVGIIVGRVFQSWRSNGVSDELGPNPLAAGGKNFLFGERLIADEELPDIGQGGGDLGLDETLGDGREKPG